MRWQQKFLARWGDMGSRRSLFDRALVGRLSATADTPVVDFLVGAFARCADQRSRKGSAASPELVEIFEYVAELCISYVDLEMSRGERRELLLHKYGFECTCARCQSGAP